MHDVTTKQAGLAPAAQHPNFAKYYKRFPTSAWLRQQ